MIGKKIAAAAIALLVFVACGGGDDPFEEGETGASQQEPEQEGGQADRTAIGQPLELDGQEPDSRFRVTAVRIADPATPKDAQFGGPTQEGTHFVSVELKLENIGEKTYEDSPTNGGKLIDSNDQSYSTTIAEVAEGPAFASEQVNIPPGDARTGWITWEIPDGTTLRAFTYALNSGFGPETGEWSLG